MLFVDIFSYSQQTYNNTYTIHISYVHYFSQKYIKNSRSKIAFQKQLFSLMVIWENCIKGKRANCNYINDGKIINHTYVLQVYSYILPYIQNLQCYPYSTYLYYIGVNTKMVLKIKTKQRSWFIKNVINLKRFISLLYLYFLQHLSFSLYSVICVL